MTRRWARPTPRGSRQAGASTPRPSHPDASSSPCRNPAAARPNGTGRPPSGLFRELPDSRRAIDLDSVERLVQRADARRFSVLFTVDMNVDHVAEGLLTVVDSRLVKVDVRRPTEFVRPRSFLPRPVQILTPVSSALREPHAAKRPGDTERCNDQGHHRVHSRMITRRRGNPPQDVWYVSPGTNRPPAASNPGMDVAIPFSSAPLPHRGRVMDKGTEVVSVSTADTVARKPLYVPLHYVPLHWRGWQQRG